ncbi:response regulator transcription factor [Embleya scabrispora]|uniref:response regulator transcription factor n=1 Tax=Embleya scabrispora TaxID=159449 RepID=UPI000D1C6468
MAGTRGRSGGSVEPAPRTTLPGTPREHEVLVAGGHTNPGIARRPHITEGTTGTHVGHLLTKFAARDRW